MGDGRRRLSENLRVSRPTPHKCGVNEVGLARALADDTQEITSITQALVLTFLNLDSRESFRRFDNPM